MAEHEQGSGARDPAPHGNAPVDPAGDAWYFSVRLGEARYAFDAPLVTEVVRLGPLTRLPAAPAFLAGVFTHRGEILPVLDLGELLLRRGTELRPGARAAVVHAGPWRVAVVADRVDGLLRIARGRLEPPPPAHGASEFLKAVTVDGADDVAVLDMGRLVAAAHARSVAT
jgi:purine-binding chemotaxis protein CheW